MHGVTPAESDLPDWLRTHGALGIDDVVPIATGLADQLAALHAAGMVHGALTPAAVRVEQVGDLIRPARFDRSVYQQTGGPTPADDVYALGMLIRTLLDAADPVADGRPPPLRALAERCTAAAPTDRPTAADVAGELRSIGRDLLLGFAAEPVAPAGTTPDYVPTATEADPSPAPRQRRRLVPVFVVAGVALLLAVAAVVVVLTVRDGSDGPAGGVTSGKDGVSTPSPGGSIGPVPPRTDPIGRPYVLQGSEVVLNQASGHGCRAWMNASDPGPYVQGVITSSGDDCEMAVWRSRNAKVFAVLSGAHRIHTGAESTKYYWAGDIFLVRVCLTNHATRQSACGRAFGGSRPTVGPRTTGHK